MQETGMDKNLTSELANWLQTGKNPPKEPKKEVTKLMELMADLARTTDSSERLKLKRLIAKHRESISIPQHLMGIE